MNSCLEHKRTEGSKVAIIVPLGLERKRWIRKDINASLNDRDMFWAMYH
jgi:hypothetical protein